MKKLCKITKRGEKVLDRDESLSNGLWEVLYDAGPTSQAGIVLPQLSTFKLIEEQEREFRRLERRKHEH